MANRCSKSDFVSGSVFAEHLEGTRRSSDGPRRPQTSSNSLDGLFGSEPSSHSNPAPDRGRMAVKPW
jgi:hypothetical protein